MIEDEKTPAPQPVKEEPPAPSDDAAPMKARPLTKAHEERGHITNDSDPGIRPAPSIERKDREKKE